MKVVYKYKIERLLEQEIVMKPGVILDVQMQGTDIYLWALVDPDAEGEIRKFQVIGTGQFVENDTLTMSRYIATVQEFKGALIWHIFEDCHAKV